MKFFTEFSSIFYNFTEAALEEAQGPLQVVQGGADGGVGAVPGGRARPAAGRPRTGRWRAERGGAAARVARPDLPRLRRQRPLRRRGYVPGLRLRLLHGDVSEGDTIYSKCTHQDG